MEILTHVIAAMVGGAFAIGGYVIVKVGAEQEKAYERKQAIEEMLMEYGKLVAESGSQPCRLDACKYAKRIMEVG